MHKSFVVRNATERKEEEKSFILQSVFCVNYFFHSEKLCLDNLLQRAIIIRDFGGQTHNHFRISGEEISVEHKIAFQET